MGYYKSISKTSKFDQIILLGNSTKTLNFQKFVSQSLQLPAIRVQKLNTIAVGGGVDPGDLNENLATIGTRSAWRSRAATSPRPTGSTSFRRSTGRRRSSSGSSRSSSRPRGALPHGRPRLVQAGHRDREADGAPRRRDGAEGNESIKEDSRRPRRSRR
jgi:hypothetical protein